MVYAKIELHIAIAAENANSTPTPHLAQIRPPIGAARMEMKWLIDMPVDMVDARSSRLLAMLRM